MAKQKKKGTGLETGHKVKVKDLPDEKTRELIKKYANLTDEDDVPGDVQEVVHACAIKFETEIREDLSGLDLASMEVSFELYSKELDEQGNVVGFSKLEMPQEFSAIKWNKVVQPAIPPEDEFKDEPELDGNGDPIPTRLKGSVRAEIPTLQTLMGESETALLDAVRQAMFQKAKELIPAWSEGIEAEL